MYGMIHSLRQYPGQLDSFGPEKYRNLSVSTRNENENAARCGIIIRLRRPSDGARLLSKHPEHAHVLYTLDSTPFRLHFMFFTHVP
jgi:hypothetical protein